MKLYVRRTISQCLGEGWTLMSTNIGRVAKSLWWPALLTAATAGFTAFVNLRLQRGIAEQAIVPADIVMAVVAVAAILCTSIIFHAKIFTLINEQTTRWCLIRTTKLMMVTLGIILAIPIATGAIIAALIMLLQSGSIDPVTYIALFVAVIIAFIILYIIVLSPLLYTNVKYMIEPEMRLREIWKYYKRGFKHIGKLFAFLFLSTLIIIIAQFIIALPSNIAMLAAKMSLDGVAFGDPDGLPSNFMLIYSMTGAISAFVTCILMTWFTLSQYYLYASIEAKYRK